MELTAEEILDALEHPAEATKRIREERGLSQRAFARRAGLHRSSLRSVERGGEPLVSTMVKILRAA